jgi:hypothetical protein
MAIRHNISFDDDDADAWLAAHGHLGDSPPPEDDEVEALDDDFPLGDGTADTSAEVICPYCGEPCEIALDPGSGTSQSYVEDCPVCCRPWQVSVHYDADGAAHVHCDADDALLDD